MALFGIRLTEYREDEAGRSSKRLAHLEEHGKGSTDAARSERSNIRYQQKQLAEEEN